MRKKIIAGNWKMFCGDPEKAVALAKGVIELCGGQDKVDVAVCPPATAIAAVAAACKGTVIGVGAQNIYPKDEGAFTGEISAVFLKALGCQYVILGHSERRTYFKETDAFVNEKVKAALAQELTPIVCVGETEQERESGITEKVVDTQVRGALAGLTAEQIGKLVVAYEPVWAIGTGKNATPADAQAVHACIRALLVELAGAEVAESVRIQYGGSMKPDNAAELLSQKDIDGGLIGGASLKAESFLGIVKAGF